MLISWNWLKQYVPLDMSPDELAERLMMAGLNHESTSQVGGDLAIDLEVTSNRPDCLGHIGIAREVSVLWDCLLKVPAARAAASLPPAIAPVEELVRVRIDCPDLCPRYTARVVRGVRVGPSPDWMVRRLKTVGIATINNVVDISNYVMMENGQPLHTFDYGKLRGPKTGTGREMGTGSQRSGVPVPISRPLRSEPVPFSGREIIIRRPLGGETIEAIDHKTYPLDPDMCVIADAEVAVAIGGVMGGAATEVNESTRDVLVEAADFDPISIRTTARRLSLHSDSSYRFERRVDPEGIDWASRRCCELILEIAGGKLASGVVDVGQRPQPRQPIVLRLAQLKRILGIEVDAELVRRILVALGNVSLPSPTGRGERGDAITVIPPTWRRDLSREIDLVEEVARIHGYDKIPEDVSVPMAPSARRREDRVVEKVREVLTAGGFDEALTLSAVDEASAGVVQVWTAAEPLRSLMPVIRGADHLRTSLVPSLLAARRTNEALSNPEIELFEIAKIYLSVREKGTGTFCQDGPSAGTVRSMVAHKTSQSPFPNLPEEWWMLGVTSGRDYASVRGVIEGIVTALNPALQLEVEDAGIALLDSGAACRLLLDGELLGYVGRLAPEGLKQFDLRGPTTVAEVRLAPLVARAELVPQYVPLSPYPAVTRDLNLVVDETVRWAQIAATVRRNAGADLEGLDYRDTWRDAERLGRGKKSLLLSIALRSQEGTLTNQQADEVRDRIVLACKQEHGAELRA